MIILRDSPIALITPIRDGMNLVAKEYVACQIDDPGVLILSPFTGIYFIAKIGLIAFFWIFFVQYKGAGETMLEGRVSDKYMILFEKNSGIFI